MRKQPRELNVFFKNDVHDLNTSFKVPTLSASEWRDFDKLINDNIKNLKHPIAAGVALIRIPEFKTSNKSKQDLLQTAAMIIALTETGHLKSDEFNGPLYIY